MSKTEQDVTKLLEDYVKKDKIRKKDIPEVIFAIQTAFEQEELSPSKIVDLVTSMHFTIIGPFAEEILLTLPEHQQIMILDSFLNADRINANAAHYGIRRVIKLVSALLGNGASSAHVDKALRRAVNLYSEKGSNEKTDEVFRDCISDLLDLDYDSWENNEVTTLCMWLQSMVDYIEDENLVGRIRNFHGRWMKTPTEKEVHPPAEQLPQKGLLHQGERLFRELETFFVNLSKEYVETKASEAAVRADFDELGTRYKQLQSIVEQLQEKNHALSGTVNELNQCMKELRDENTELNRRLEIAYSAEGNQAKYELEVYKADLVKRLGTKYQDYLYMASQDASPESYQILLTVLEDVFDTLRRKGIEFAI
jgi:FtsZ-binding cell division protein ZapB